MKAGLTTERVLLGIRGASPHTGWKLSSFVSHPQFSACVVKFAFETAINHNIKIAMTVAAKCKKSKEKEKTPPLEEKNSSKCGNYAEKQEPHSRVTHTWPEGGGVLEGSEQELQFLPTQPAGSHGLDSGTQKSEWSVVAHRRLGTCQNQRGSCKKRKIKFGMSLLNQP